MNDSLSCVAQSLTQSVPRTLRSLLRPPETPTELKWYLVVRGGQKAHRTTLRRPGLGRGGAREWTRAHIERQRETKNPLALALSLTSSRVPTGQSLMCLDSSGPGADPHKQRKNVKREVASERLHARYAQHRLGFGALLWPPIVTEAVFLRHRLQAVLCSLRQLLPPLVLDRAFRLGLSRFHCSAVETDTAGLRGILTNSTTTL